VAGAAYLGFCERGGGPEALAADRAETAGVVLTLVTDHVDDWFAHLRAQGVPVVKEPAENPPYRIYNAFVRDPNGYLVEIQRFWEPLA
jgi:catechol 2,3-dioxygenase-like lactoylglutathione lyase family enzyme